MTKHLIDIEQRALEELVAVALHPGETIAPETHGDVNREHHA